MVVKIYVSGISGNKEVKKKQQRVQMILDSKSISYEAIDITEPGREKDKEFMQQNGKVREALGKHPLPPQLFNECEYCGDYEDFDMANEVDELEAFLHLPIPTKAAPDNAATIDAKVNGSREDTEVSGARNGTKTTEINGDVELTPIAPDINESLSKGDDEGVRSQISHDDAEDESTENANAENAPDNDNKPEESQENAEHDAKEENVDERTNVTSTEDVVETSQESNNAEVESEEIVQQIVLDKVVELVIPTKPSIIDSIEEENASRIELDEGSANINTKNRVVPAGLEDEIKLKDIDKQNCGDSEQYGEQLIKGASNTDLENNKKETEIKNNLTSGVQPENSEDSSIIYKSDSDNSSLSIVQTNIAPAEDKGIKSGETNVDQLLVRTTTRAEDSSGVADSQRPESEVAKYSELENKNIADQQGIKSEKTNVEQPFIASKLTAEASSAVADSWKPEAEVANFSGSELSTGAPGKETKDLSGIHVENMVDETVAAASGRSREASPALQVLDGKNVDAGIDMSYGRAPLHAGVSTRVLLTNENSPYDVDKIAFTPQLGQRAKSPARASEGNDAVGDHALCKHVEEAPVVDETESNQAPPHDGILTKALLAAEDSPFDVDKISLTPQIQRARSPAREFAKSAYGTTAQEAERLTERNDVTHTPIPVPVDPSLDTDDSLPQHDGVPLRLLLTNENSPFDVDKIAYTPQLKDKVKSFVLKPEERGIKVKRWDRRPSEIDLVKHVRSLLDERDLKMARRARDKEPHNEFLDQLFELINDVSGANEDVPWPVVKPLKEPTPPVAVPEPPEDDFIQQVLRALNGPITQKPVAEPEPDPVEQDSLFLKQVWHLLDSENLAETPEGHSFPLIRKRTGNHEETAFVKKVRVLLDEKEEELNKNNKEVQINVIEPTPEISNHKEFLSEVLGLLSENKDVDENLIPEAQVAENSEPVIEVTSTAEEIVPEEIKSEVLEDVSVGFLRVICEDCESERIKLTATIDPKNDVVVVKPCLPKDAAIANEEFEIAKIIIISSNGEEKQLASIVMSPQ